MMAFGSIFTQERSRDKDAVIRDLQTELRRTQAKLTEETRKRAEAEANVRRLQTNRRNRYTIPHGDAEDGYECGVAGCYAPLEEDYKYCPGCGSEIDWRTWTEPQGMYDSWREYRIDMEGTI